MQWPIFGAKVLAVDDGVLDLHGSSHVHTWRLLESTATAGDTEITVIGNATDWAPQSTIVIATTAFAVLPSTRAIGLKQWRPQ